MHDEITSKYILSAWSKVSKMGRNKIYFQYHSIQKISKIISDDHAKAEIPKIKITGYQITYAIASYSYKCVCFQEYNIMYDIK